MTEIHHNNEVIEGIVAVLPTKEVAEDMPKKKAKSNKKTKKVKVNKVGRPVGAKTKKKKGEKEAVKKTPKSSIEKKLKEYQSSQLQFLDESELIKFFKLEDNLTKKNLSEIHSIDNIAEIESLKFNWNDRKLDKEHVKTLEQSIRLRGIFEPIVIGLNLENGKPTLEVIRGQHRTSAIKQLRKKADKKEIAIASRKLRLPAKVVIYQNFEEYNDDSKQRWSDAASNIPELIKKDDVFSRAKAFDNVRSELAKGSTGNVAKSLGLSKSTVRDTLNVLKLPNEIQKLIETNLSKLKESFIYKMAARFSKVERNFDKEIRERAIEVLKIELDTIETKGPDGKLIKRLAAIPPDKKPEFDKKFQELKNKGQERLKELQAEAAKEILSLIKKQLKLEKDASEQTKTMSPADRIFHKRISSVIEKMTSDKVDKKIIETIQKYCLG